MVQIVLRPMDGKALAYCTTIEAHLGRKLAKGEAVSLAVFMDAVAAIPVAKIPKDNNHRDPVAAAVNAAVWALLGVEQLKEACQVARCIVAFCAAKVPEVAQWPDGHGGRRLSEELLNEIRTGGKDKVRISKIKEQIQSQTPFHGAYTGWDVLEQTARSWEIKKDGRGVIKDRATSAVSRYLHMVEGKPEHQKEIFDELRQLVA